MYFMINNRVHKFNIEQISFKNLLAGTPSTWVDEFLHQLKHQPTTPLLPTVFDNLPLLPAVQSLTWHSALALATLFQNVTQSNSPVRCGYQRPLCLKLPLSSGTHLLSPMAWPYSRRQSVRACFHARPQAQMKRGR